MENFIRQRLKRTCPAFAFNKARRVVDIYDLQGLADHFHGMLSRDEISAGDFARSCRIIAIIAEQGDPGQDRFAAEYFSYLAGHGRAAENYEILLETLESLGPDADPQPLANRLHRDMEALRPRIGHDPDADNLFQETDQFLNNLLPAVLSLRKAYLNVPGIEDPEKRITELCRIYLQWERNGTYETEWWAARHIRREAKGGNGEKIFTAFRDIITRIEDTMMSKEERMFYKVRSLRAIQYLGAPLTGEERRYLAGARHSQTDVLFYEP